MFLFLIPLYSIGLDMNLSNSFTYSISIDVLLTICQTLDKGEELRDEKKLTSNLKDSYN